MMLMIPARDYPFRFAEWRVPWRKTVSRNPLNLGLRFLLEVLALMALGYWGWSQGDGASRYLWAVGGPLLLAIIWGTFRVPEDPSASGRALIPVRGVVRLLLELFVFGLATWALFDAGASSLAALFGAMVLLHYTVSYDRVVWLLRQ